MARNESYWLTTDRLGLRRFTPDDLDWLLELYSDLDVTRYLGGVKARAQIQEMLDVWVLRYYDEHPGLGIWVTHERATGAPVGLHLAFAMLRYGFVDRQLPRITAIANLDNVASQHVLTKIGLERRGERAFAHPAYAAAGPLAWFEREAGEWLAWVSGAEEYLISGRARLLRRMERM